MARGFKTGGRQKGTPNKRTLERRARTEEAIKAIANANGSGVFDGNAHDLLKLFYKTEAFPAEFRAKCAEAALKFEKPALQAVDSTIKDQRPYVIAMPAPFASLDEWDRHASAVIAATDATKDDSAH
jgi:hypothetical protein